MTHFFTIPFCVAFQERESLRKTRVSEPNCSFRAKLQFPSQTGNFFNLLVSLGERSFARRAQFRSGGLGVSLRFQKFENFPEPLFQGTEKEDEDDYQEHTEKASKVSSSFLGLRPAVCSSGPSALYWHPFLQYYNALLFLQSSGIHAWHSPPLARSARPTTPAILWMRASPKSGGVSRAVMLEARGRPKQSGGGWKLPPVDRFRGWRTAEAIESSSTHALFPTGVGLRSNVARCIIMMVVVRRSTRILVRRRILRSERGFSGSNFRRGCSGSFGSFVWLSSFSLSTFSSCLFASSALALRTTSWIALPTKASPPQTTAVRRSQAAARLAPPDRDAGGARWCCGWVATGSLL